jgi:sugar lactone lactonase YvrE
MSKMPLLDPAKATVFFDGIFTEPRLRHPEGIAIDIAGNIWCGSETGDIYRIAADGSAIETVASTGGFILGIAFDSRGQLYCCDLKHRAVFRLSADRVLTRFADGGGDMRTPNFPVVDEQTGSLYVSDSYSPTEPGPGIWRFDLDSGKGSMWYAEPLMFANGMALDPGGESLLVVESFAQRVTRVPVRRDGTPGAASTVASGLQTVPDGLALDAAGNLYVSCYEPSRIYRVTASGEVSVLIEDLTAHTLCHPTNCAFRGSEMFAANLGRWHITRVEMDVEGLALPAR